MLGGKVSLEFHESLNHMVRKEDTSAGSEVLGDASFKDRIPYSLRDTVVTVLRGLISFPVIRSSSGGS